jgi:hypothetical protein
VVSVLLEIVISVVEAVDNVVLVAVWVAAEVDLLVLDLADWHRVFPGQCMVINRYLTQEFGQTHAELDSTPEDSTVVNRLNSGSNSQGQVHVQMMVVEGALVMIHPVAHLEDTHIVHVCRSTVKNSSLVCTLVDLGSTPEHSTVIYRSMSGLNHQELVQMAIAEGVAVVVLLYPAARFGHSVNNRCPACTLVRLGSTP